MKRILILFFLLSGCSKANEIMNIQENNIKYKNIYIYPLNNNYNLEQPNKNISISPNKELAIIQRQIRNEFYDQDGKETIETENVCDIIRLSDGCPLSSNQGEVCSALWDENSSIQTSQGDIFINLNNIEIPSPTELAQEIYDTGLTFNISAYLKCYPENESNINSYNYIKQYLSDNNRQDELYIIDK